MTTFDVRPASPRSAEITSLASDGGAADRFQGVCSCGWSSAAADSRAAVARAVLQHSANSSCHPLIGGASADSAAV